MPRHPRRKKTDPVKYSLVIKGTREMAELACQERLLDASFARTVNDITVMETHLRDDDINVLATWLVERPDTIPQYGFPQGTLLLYSPHPRGEI